MSWKFKILFPFVVIILLVATKFILWDFPISSGKRVGNLTKLSKKGKFWFTKTWEGTIDEGSGDKLTSYFSISDDNLAQELYSYEGREVVVYYEQYLVGWPRETTYDIVSWKPKKSEFAQAAASASLNVENSLLEKVESTLFCSFLGTLLNDKELYAKVKEHIKENNMYLYMQYDRCNE